ncbi:FAD-dependent oxidoreductase [uncultured Piscinibacter sp.]|uniref:NAD(P)/FAD-dependent oxidoreductase n=1 Tax=uncultured Piscinibacter sp. TaxID=1131835 RepID=UPI0026315A0E|nr:FAD-dependent oxidoreductase [uncultured Piscinibacter sp.]
MNHVILGAGPAGVIAAETIRKHAPHDRIVLVGDEPEAPYSRMAIPYLLIGNIQEEGTHLRHGAGHFEQLRIEIKRGRAKGIDTGRHQVHLEDGSSLPFDKLLIATGSSPIRPPIRGMDLPNVHSCWTLADARAIAQRAGKGARVLQMGAGFIGCIIMEALAARGVELTVVEMGDRMVPRMMGPTAGGMIKDWCEKKGVRVFTGTRVEAIEGAGAADPGLLGRIASAVGLGGSAGGSGAMKVKLSNGQTLDADLVISATGVKPNIGFLENSPIKCLQGVLTDEHLQTTVPGIYAAGDCAEAFDVASGKTIVSAIQPNAADQAYIAAMNMVGKAAALKGVTQINVLDTLGLISTSFGNWQGVAGGEQVELTDRPAGRHLSLQFKDDVMVGCNSIGWTEHVGVMRGLVEGQVRLGEWKEKLKQDPTLLMEAYLASAQGQSTRALVPPK